MAVRLEEKIGQVETLGVAAVAGARSSTAGSLVERHSTVVLVAMLELADFHRRELLLAVEIVAQIPVAVEHVEQLPVEQLPAEQPVPQLPVVPAEQRLVVPRVLAAAGNKRKSVVVVVVAAIMKVQAQLVVNPAGLVA